jgi:hypothetical protein
MKKKPIYKLFSLYLAFAVVLLTLPAQSWAMFIPAEGSATARKADIATIQRTLEATVVKQRLMDFGLAPEEAMARINGLSDEQTHTLAENLNSLQAGADGGLDAVAFVLVVAILVVLILELTGHHVIFR